MINNNNNLYGNSRTEEEELEKAKKYQDLAREILRLWKTSANVISIVVKSTRSSSEPRWVHKHAGHKKE